MDISDLHLNIDYVGSCGIILSSEQKVILQTTLTTVKHENKFISILFWGIIRGINGDYYVVKGIGKDSLSDETFLYSKDCCAWGLLPVPTKEDIEKSKLFRTRLTGDPTHEDEYVDIKQIPGEGDELIESEDITTLKEENRLAAIIHRINEEAFLIPRGAYLKTPSGKVIRNKGFEGLSLSEASKPVNYLHFCKETRQPSTYKTDRSNYDKAIDFLNTIENDIPKGCWVIQFERGSTLALVKSLLWIGYVLYHLPNTDKYGSIYVGTGEYNIDLPFML